ncbi:hypothetical protein LDENG_00262400, partial [Lucifuga dentata]
FCFANVICWKITHTHTYTHTHTHTHTHKGHNIHNIHSVIQIQYLYRHYSFYLFMPDSHYKIFQNLTVDKFQFLVLLYILNLLGQQGLFCWPRDCQNQKIMFFII